MARKKKEELVAANTNDVAATDTPVTPVEIPSIYSWEWTDFVFSKLREEELIDKVPTQAGLLRIFEEVMSAYYKTPVVIRNLSSLVVQSPNVDNNNHAVVQSTIIYTEMGTCLDRTVTEVADCYSGNTAIPFSLHAVATASTLALGRALRKALRLRQGVHTKEELMPASPAQMSMTRQLESSMTKPIDQGQLAVITSISKRLGIDPNKLVGPDSEYPDFTSLEGLDFNTAATVVQLVNQYQQDAKPIPERLIA